MKYNAMTRIEFLQHYILLRASVLDYMDGDFVAQDAIKAWDIITSTAQTGQDKERGND